jgi:hypothetical protein
MKAWQRDALKVIRKTRAHATEISDKNLHLACARAIQVMVMEGGQVPRELRDYAYQTRLTFCASDEHMDLVG